jgi:hypothetical protein
MGAFASNESDVFERLAQEFPHMWFAIDDAHPRRHFSAAERRQRQDFFSLFFGHSTPYDLKRGTTLFFDHPKSEAFRKKPLRN